MQPFRVRAWRRVPPKSPHLRHRDVLALQLRSVLKRAHDDPELGGWVIASAPTEMNLEATESRPPGLAHHARKIRRPLLLRHRRHEISKQDLTGPTRLGSPPP